MHKLFSVIKREFITRVNGKGFVLGTIAMPVFVLIMVFLPAVLNLIKSEDTRVFAVLDQSVGIFEPLQKQLDQKTDSGQPLYQLVAVENTDGDIEATKEEKKTAIIEDQLNGLIVIPADVRDSGKVEFYSKNVSNFTLNRELYNAISKVVQDQRIAEYGVAPEIAAAITKDIDLTTLRVSKGGETQQDRGFTFVLTYVLVLFVYLALIIYGASTMNAVIEEKGSRVVEVLTSSVRPVQLMAGKIIGVGCVGMLQFFIWAITASLIVAYAGVLIKMMGLGAGDVSFPEVKFGVMASFVVYFVLGYFVYGTLYASLGAMSNSTEEGQHLQWFVLIFLIFGIILVQFVIPNPSSTASVVLSFIPMFAPILMFTRIVVETPPMIEIVASIAILVASILLLMWIAGKIYRVGILMYGKRPNLPEVLRWIRY